MASDDETIILWDSASGKLLRVLEGHADRVFSIAFSPDGERLVSASLDSTLKLWDPETGIAVATLRGHLDKVYGVAWSPHGKRIASCGTGWSGAGNTVKVWEMETPTEVYLARAQANLDRELVFSRVEALFEELFFEQRVIEMIRTDPWFEARSQDTDRLRDVAIQLARVQGSNPWRILDGCWRGARSRHQSVETYHLAVRVGRDCYERSRTKATEVWGRAHTALGMALYRADRWDEAIELLEGALRINGENAADLAFVTMCQHRLGDAGAAEATLQRLRDLLARPGHASNPADREAVDEAEELLGAPTRITRSST